jgi:RNA polymerase sigma-70 factor (ECF subfamily)
LIKAPGELHFLIVRSLAGTLDVECSPSAPSTLDFSAIFRTYSPYAWRALRRLGVAEADASDTCQEVFMVLHRKLGDIADARSVRSFVYGVCVRVAADYRRSARVRHEQISDRLPETAIGAHQDKDLETRQARAHLDAVLARLDDVKREVFVLYELEELTMPEIVDALGCPLQTAYSRLHAARNEVRAAFARDALAEVR